MIEDICTALADIGGMATGIRTAFDPPPPNLESGALPALYVFTGGGIPDDKLPGSKLVQMTRTLRVQVAVLPTGMGDPKTRETQCRPLLDALYAAIWAHPRLNKLARVRSARVTSDSGIVLLPEWGMRFIGFEVRVEVITIEPRTIAKGE
jgi:hypothetical protein